MFRVLCRVTDNAEERERIIKTPALRRIARISLPELGIIRDIGGYMSAKDDVERATFAIGLTSIPLRKLDAKKEVISNASGCLVDYYGHRLLLSVSHKSLADGNWAIEEGFDRDKGTRLHQVGGLKYVARGDWGTLKRDAIDFSYASVPSDLVSLYQEIDAGRYITKQAQRTVFKETFETEPNPKELYAFSGQTRHSKENWFLCSTNMVVMGLTFERSEGDFHHFKLPFRHPGHDSFHGCGGAPIIDSEARVVALVCGGDTETDTVYGVSLKKMKPILDIETGRFVGA
jgi:hypothetical protein